jgi:hypothetical protein
MPEAAYVAYALDNQRAKTAEWVEANAGPSKMTVREVKVTRIASGYNSNHR